MTEPRIPPPSYALSLWLAGDRICIAIPEAGICEIGLDRLEPQRSDFGSVVPGNRGLAVLLDMLRARAASRPRTIGRPGVPVRNDVEKALESDEKYLAWLAALAEDKEAKAAQRVEAEKVLGEIGL